MWRDIPNINFVAYHCLKENEYLAFSCENYPFLPLHSAIAQMFSDSMQNGEQRSYSPVHGSPEPKRES
jgi:hypothetical protein